MARSDTTERIATAPRRLWRFFQPDQMAWYGVKLEPLSPGPLGQGARIRVSGGPAGSGYEATVTEYAENRMLTWEGSDRRASHRVAFLLTPKESATVVLIKHEVHPRGLFGRLTDGLTAGRISGHDRSALRRLKSLAEQGDPPA